MCPSGRGFLQYSLESVVLLENDSFDSLNMSPRSSGTMAAGFSYLQDAHS